jgi:Transcriptional regulators
MPVPDRQTSAPDPAAGDAKEERTPMDLSCDDRFVRFSVATDTLSKTLQKYKNDCLEPFGLRSMHLMTLWCLWRNADGLTAGDLSRLCSVDKAFVSRVTGELGELGYVDRGEERGGRGRILTLTARGREIMKKIEGILRYSVERITAGVGREQLDVFYGVLDRFRQNIDTLSENKPDGIPAGASPSDEETKAES